MEKLNILYVDDNEDLLRAFEYFAGEDHDVETTTSPEKALKLVSLNKDYYDLIVTDLNLERRDIDGFKLAVKFREHTSVPIIMLTGDIVEDLKAQEFGICKVFEKPLVRNTFIDIINYYESQRDQR